MHALTCAGSPTTESKKKPLTHNEVRMNLTFFFFVASFAANSMKHLIMPNCLEDRTHTRAIRSDMHGQLLTGKQHLGKRITKYDVCLLHNTMLNYTRANKRMTEAMAACINEHQHCLVSALPHTQHISILFSCLTNIHYRSKVWGHPDNFMSSMKTHFYFSNELKIESKI